MSIEKIKHGQSYIEYLEDNIALYKKLANEGVNYPKSSSIVALYRGHEQAFVSALQAYKSSLNMTTANLNEEVEE